ncbi:hypothetical protein ACFORO_19885 [Amycolatopsis halotolerans]|uniref:Uncharacterized protein n=1 Tax=Amycolatopsis halotolerans TaxID=330083 RepID=A0ABV7QJG7_9PSEU
MARRQIGRVHGSGNVTGQLGPLRDSLEIADVHRLARPDEHAEPSWRIEGQNFDIRLRARGHRQYLRMPPQQVSRRVLTMFRRNGISFAGRQHEMLVRTGVTVWPTTSGPKEAQFGAGITARHADPPSACARRLAGCLACATPDTVTAVLAKAQPVGSTP